MKEEMAHAMRRVRARCPEARCSGARGKAQEAWGFEMRRPAGSCRFIRNAAGTRKERWQMAGTQDSSGVRHPFREDWAMLYVAGYGNMMKVGISNAPLRRLATLQTAAPERISLFYLAAMPTREDARKLESRMHAKLSDRRMSGEWFCVDREDAKDMAARELARARRGVAVEVSRLEEFIAGLVVVPADPPPAFDGYF